MGRSFNRPLTDAEKFTLFEDPNITNVDQLPSSIRRNKRVRADLQSILGRKAAGRESNITDLQNLIKGIARPISFNVPAPNFEPTDRERQEQRFLDAQRDELRKFIQGVRSGTIAPEVTSPEQRTRLIERAGGDFSRILESSQEQLFGELNRRGLLGTGGGFSGPTAAIQARERARVFEDPFTSFIRDLDIATEAERVNRQQELNDLALASQERLLGSGESIFQFLKELRLGQEGLGLERNLGLSRLQATDRARQGSLLSGLLGLQVQRQESALDRSFDRDMFRERKRMQSQGSGSGLGSIIGGILGNIPGGPFGNILNNTLGSTLGAKKAFPVGTLNTGTNVPFMGQKVQSLSALKGIPVG